MRFDLEDIIAVSSTGEDKVIFLDRNNYEVVEEFKLLIPNNKKYNMENYFGPHGLAFDNNRKYMYVANSYNGSISIIDLLKWNMVENICVGTSPCHLDISKKNNFIYVTNYDSDTVSGIDLNKNSVAVQIPVNRMPHDLHMSNDGKSLFVAGLGSEEIFVIDTQDNSVCDKIVLNCCAMHFKISRCNKYLYASCSNFNCENQGILCIVDISQRKVMEKIKIGIYLSDIALRETTKEIFLLDAETNYLYKLSIEDGKMSGKAETGKFPSCIGIDDEKNIAIIGNHLDNTIEIFDLDDLRRIKRIRVGKDLNYISKSTDK
mgnify:CR=1 FL=1